jgi:Outer membrane protein and related peptidoglycan-associated (lipo)proteins
MEPGDGDSAPSGDVQQAPSDGELFEFFPQTEFGENEFGLASEYDNWQRQLNGGRSRKSEKCNCHQAQANSGEFEFGAYDRESPPVGSKPRTIDIGEIVICGGPPFASLDNFSFGKSTLRKDSTRNHPAQIDAVAREIENRAASGRPVPTVCITGHTDYVGAQDYNYTLGLLRARAVKEALCKALGSRANTMTFVVSSLGETDPTPRGTSATARGRNRRVDIHLLSQRQNGERCAPVGGRRVPPDPAGCGVPLANPQRELEIAHELQEFEGAAPPRRVRVQPKLCLYQEASNTSHRNHFQHQALGTARRIGAIGSPDASNCNARIGATPYSSGADIINAIRAAWQCLGRKPIQSVHIFGHSGSYGLFGSTGGTAGLYQNSFSLDAATRTGGGRNIADIPTDVLANNVIFVLHGCNQAFGCNVQGDDDNFAQSLLEHLSGALTNPRVYGHYNSGCAGRDNSWCLYSKTIPKGRANSRPDYTDPGGCAPAGREFEFESEEEGGKKPRQIDMPSEKVTVNICNKIQSFMVDNYGRGVHQLNTSQQAIIDQIKKAIRKRAHTCRGLSTVEVRGHASTEGPAGRNKDLGLHRAEVVRDALRSAFTGATVFTTSKGEADPRVTPDPTDALQRKNRRVEIFVM